MPGRHILSTDGQLIHSFCLDGCLFYGFGEKTGPLEKTGHRMRFSNKDAIGYDPEKTDPLYKHVPFFLKLNPDGKGVCGVFYHTAAECELYIGREHNGYYPPMGQFLTRQFVAADGAVLPQILDTEAFEAAKSGWHYDAEKKLCSFKAGSTRKVQISFGTFDLIKMDV